MNRKRSLVISTIGHVVILSLSLILGIVGSRNLIRRETIQVNLLDPKAEPGPLGKTPEQKSEQPKKTEEKKEEKKPTIIEREIEKPKPRFSPSDIAKLEKLMNEGKKEETKTVNKTPSETNTGNRGGGGTYEGLIQQIVRNNWNQPARAVLGANPPEVVVSIRVDRRGSILSSRVIKSSGISRLDDSALQAVRDSNPLPEFPEYMGWDARDFNLEFIVDR